MFNLITHGYGDIVQSTLVRFFHANKDGKSSAKFEVDRILDIVRGVANGGESGFNITEQRHRKFGKCYSLHPIKEHRLLGIYYIKFIL